jgi:hypothetical protein
LFERVEGRIIFLVLSLANLCSGLGEFFRGLELTTGYKSEWLNGKQKPQPTQKPIGVAAKVEITSLNSHFAKI